MSLIVGCALYSSDFARQKGACLNIGSVHCALEDKSLHSFKTASGTWILWALCKYWYCTLKINCCNCSRLLLEHQHLMGTTMQCASLGCYKCLVGQVQILCGFDSSACTTLGTIKILKVSISMVALLCSSLQFHYCHCDKNCPVYACAQPLLYKVD